MAFCQKPALCPFCGSAQFEVSLFVNDMPVTNKPSESGERLSLLCCQCGKRVFDTSATQGGQLSAVGVSVCERCKRDFYNASGGEWHEENIAKTTYPVGTERCPRCGSFLRRCWWHGWNYTIGSLSLKPTIGSSSLKPSEKLRHLLRIRRVRYYRICERVENQRQTGRIGLCAFVRRE